MRKKRESDLKIILIGAFLLMILIVFLFIILKPRPFLAPPNLPHHFYGTVRCLNGNPILAGHSLIGHTPVDNNQTVSAIDNTFFSPYDYNLLISHGANNAEIRFYIDTTDSGNYLNNATLIFGETTRLDFSNAPDTFCSSVPSCGDGSCNGGENCSTCEQDCGACCPNTLCDYGETCSTCPADCGDCDGDGDGNGGPGPDTHKICNITTQQCVSVSGGGTDQCQNSSQCTGGQSYCTDPIFDQDLDNYSRADPIGCPWGNDCDDTNSSIHPYAPEICDDGVDNDCDQAIDSADRQCQTPLAIPFFGLLQVIITVLILGIYYINKGKTKKEDTEKEKINKEKIKKENFKT